jgi:hypothetical protein
MAKRHPMSKQPKARPVAAPCLLTWKLPCAKSSGKYVRPPPQEAQPFGPWSAINKG